MVDQAKERPKGNGRASKAKAARALSAKADVRRNKQDVRVKNAVRQKVLVNATRLGKPPAISNDVPKAMPFVTDDQ